VSINFEVISTRNDIVMIRYYLKLVEKFDILFPLLGLILFASCSNKEFIAPKNLNSKVIVKASSLKPEFKYCYAITNNSSKDDIELLYSNNNLQEGQEISNFNKDEVCKSKFANEVSLYEVGYSKTLNSADQARFGVTKKLAFVVKHFIAYATFKFDETERYELRFSDIDLLSLNKSSCELRFIHNEMVEEYLPLSSKNPIDFLQFSSKADELINELK